MSEASNGPQELEGKASPQTGEASGPTGPTEPSEQDSERRTEDRAPITLRVDYKRLNTFFADYTKNISKGGTFIRTTRPLDVGTEFMFVLSVPKVPSSRNPGEPLSSSAQAASSADADSVNIELSGRVKWVVKEDDATGDKPAGMGIQFVFAEDADRAKVDGMVSGMMHEALGTHLAAKLLKKT